jgi:hypothetical protein
MRYLIICILFLASCRCPEIVTGTVESRDTTTTNSHSVDTSITHNRDTTTTGPIIFSGEINVDSICEELYRLREAGRTEVIIDVPPVPTIKPKKSSIKITIGNDGKATIDCKTDSLTQVNDSLIITINVRDSTIQKITHDIATTKDVQVPIRDWWFYTYKYSAFILWGLILYFIIRMYLKTIKP